MKIKTTREFLGTLITAENYNQILEKEGRHGINFHNKHFRAYKQGKVMFTHGMRITEKGEKMGPMYHELKQKLTEEK